MGVLGATPIFSKDYPETAGTYRESIVSRLRAQHYARSQPAINHLQLNPGEQFMTKALVVWKLDNIIHRINRYPMDKC